MTLPGGGTEAIPSTALPLTGGEVVNETCVLRGHPGEEPQPTTHGGLRVAKVLEEFGVGNTFGYLTIPRPNGTVAYLPREYFFDPSPFEGCEFPTFSYDGNTKFFRPPLAGDPNDVNAADFIATVSGEPLAVGVHDGRVVKVQATASTTSTTAGSPVRFEATVEGGGAFDFAWTFGDGETATGGSVEHAFSGSGTYLVRVTATGTGGDESGGESGPVEVIVGNPPTTEAPGATTTPQPTTATPTGAPGKAREGRGGKGSKPAPSGEGKPKRGRSSNDDSSAQRGASPADRPSSHSPEAPATPTSSPPPELPATVAPPSPVEPSEGDSAEPPGCCSAESPSEGSPRPTPPPPSAPAGELVEGRLVGDDLGPATIAEAADGSAEGEGSRSAPGAIGKGGVGVPAIALIVVALLAGGALFEWRRSRLIS